MNFKEVIKNYFRYASNRPILYIITLVLGVIVAITSRSVPYLFGSLIDTLQLENFGGATNILFAFIIILSFNLLVDQILKEVADRIAFDDMVIKSKLDYVRALQNADYKFHTEKSSGSLISLAKRGEESIFRTFWEVNIWGGVIILEFIISVIVLATISIEFAGIFSVAILLIASITGFLVKLNITRRKTFNREKDKMSALIVDNMMGYETIKIFANEDFEDERLKQQSKPWSKSFFGYVHTFRITEVVITIITIITFGLITLYGLNQVDNSIITIGALTTALIYAYQFNDKIIALFFKIRELAKSYTDLEQFFSMINQKSNIIDTNSSKKIELRGGVIQFDNVDFGYRENQEVLKNIDVVISEGEKIALVGESGGGKTTLTKLLLRFYDVSSGKILIDGQNIQEITQSSLRRAIGLVPQEPIFFNNTILYNARYGNPNATVAEVNEALKKANLTKFIEELPEGLDTFVGERGIKLSGGQKQRLAIARIIIENPEIVIFDEATSQLDSENEKLIQEAMNNLIKDKTTIIIAHRLSTVKHVDRIFVFDSGEIAEIGSHNELIESGKIYPKLWKLQG